MTTRLASFLCAIAVTLPGCLEATDSDEQNSNGNGSNTNACTNTNAGEPCPCVDDASCPDGMYCQITDSAVPPYNGVCLPDPPPCNSNTDPNCVPPDDGCNAGDPNCVPPDNGGGCNAGDPNCVPPDDGCNAGDPNC